MSDQTTSSPIRSGIVYTRNPELGEQIRHKVLHWPMEISVMGNWEGLKELPADCRLILVDRSTMPPIEITDSCLRVILSGESDELLQALEEFLFLRDPLVSAVGIEPLLHAKCRQYLMAISTLKDPVSAYPFFCSLLDRILIPNVLEITGGNQHKASRILGMSRTTFRNKMKSIQNEGSSLKIE